MEKNNISRRKFLTTASTSTLAAVAVSAIPACGNVNKNTSTPAILGGQPIRNKPLPANWPIWDETEEKAILSALRSGKWQRFVKDVIATEKKFAEKLGSKHALFTTNGTHALISALHALGIEGGDEVLVTPNTFVATVDTILLVNALPVFVDTDPETTMMNADKLEEKITESTKAIMPVHIEGGVCDMDKINAIAKKHNLIVIEDACQAILAEWKGKKVGTLSDLGCFSFSQPKVLNCGEGGVILGDDEQIMDKCHSFQNFGRAQRGITGSRYPMLGTKCRITHFQVALLRAQMSRLEEQTNKRAENAEYLDSKLNEIPGILPRKLYDGVTRRAYYVYSFRYKKEQFKGLSRKKFVSALKAEGIKLKEGNEPPHNHEVKGGFIENTINSKTFQRIYGKKRLEEYAQQQNCPENDQLCEEAVSFSCNYLLSGSKKDMDDIYNAILKIYENCDKLI
ncbi:DegT/DnrJ/EryC1/StrS family aminotransferase [candidate division KSB1 bacterium]